jgi:hypothetical protein
MSGAVARSPIVLEDTSLKSISSISTARVRIADASDRGSLSALRTLRA